MHSSSLSLLSYSARVSWLCVLRLGTLADLVLSPPTVCRMVLKDPVVICSAEEHVVCRSCVEQCPKSSSGGDDSRRCTVCHIEFWMGDVAPSKMLERAVAALK